jgi:hypothetical protein
VPWCSPLEDIAFTTFNDLEADIASNFSGKLTATLATADNAFADRKRYSEKPGSGTSKLLWQLIAFESQRTFGVKHSITESGRRKLGGE